MQKAAVSEVVMRAALSKSALGKKLSKLLKGFLRPDEVVEAWSKVLNTGKTGIIVATNQRLIYMDKRLLTVYTRVINYASIRQIEYARKMFTSQLVVATFNGKNWSMKCASSKSLVQLATCIKKNSAISQKSTHLPTKRNFSLPLSFSGASVVYVPRHRHGKFVPSAQ